MVGPIPSSSLRVAITTDILEFNCSIIKKSSKKLEDGSRVIAGKQTLKAVRMKHPEQNRNVLYLIP